MPGARWGSMRDKIWTHDREKDSCDVESEGWSLETTILEIDAVCKRYDVFQKPDYAAPVRSAKIMKMFD